MWNWIHVEKAGHTTVFHTKNVLCTKLSQSITFCRSQQHLPFEHSINFFTLYFLKKPRGNLNPPYLAALLSYCVSAGFTQRFCGTVFSYLAQNRPREWQSKQVFFEQARNKNEILVLCLVSIQYQFKGRRVVCCFFFFSSCSLREGSIYHLRWETDSCQIIPFRSQGINWVPWRCPQSSLSAGTHN